MRSGVNLIPQPVAVERQRRRFVRRGLGVTGLYLALVLGATGGYLTLMGPRTAAASVEARAAADQRALRLTADLTQIKAKLTDTERRVRAAEVLSERPEWATLLRLIAQSASPEVMLSQVEITSDANAAGRATVLITGFAAGPGETAGFVLRLENTGIFRHVELASSRREPFGAEVVTGLTVRCDIGHAAPKGGTP